MPVIPGHKKVAISFPCCNYYDWALLSHRIGVREYYKHPLVL